MRKVYKYGWLQGNDATFPEAGFIESEGDPLNEYDVVMVYNRQLTMAERVKHRLDFLGERQIP